MVTTTKPAIQKRAIKADYLAGEPQLKPFYSYDVQQPDFESIMEDKVFSDTHRKVLHQVLTDQYQDLEVTGATARNIESLLDSQTFSLTTGHQLNLFGGPLYTPYKVITVIKLAEQLNKQYPERHVVPIFWIHTEDHDYEEINHFYPNFHTKKTYQAPFSGATGHHILSEEITSLIPTHFPKSLTEGYVQGTTLAQATLRFANELYGKYGLVVLDADHPAFKRLFQETIRQELVDQVSQGIIETTSTKLKAAGYPAQINPRAVNLFYLDENGRDRIEKVEDGFRIIGREMQFTTQEMMVEVAAHPERFSPNVALRPLYQETILPNLAYCGGWGELAYWLQLGGVFDHFSVNFPLLLPRMSAVIFREKEWEEWKALGLAPLDVSKDTHSLYKQMMPAIWNSEEFDAQSAAVMDAFSALQAGIEKISPTLPRSVEGQKVKTGHFLENLQKKIYRVIRNQQPAPFAKIEGLKEKIQPDGLVQERVLSLGAFPKVDPSAIIQQIWANCDPLSFTQQEILLKEN